MTELDEIIRAEIREAGAMRFDRFMELALYHPVCGYYTQLEDRSRIGKGGDFYTSVSVGPLFGRLLARQLFQMWQVMGQPAPFWIMEQGAHNGQLASDILEWCRTEAPEFLAAICYAIVDPSGTRRRTQQIRAEETAVLKRMMWFENIELLAKEKPVGVFVSNELVDAFPVRVVRYQAGAWRERLVEINGDGQFAWTDRAIDDVELKEAMAGLPLLPIQDYTTEINLAARKWIVGLGCALVRGYVLTIDYGYPASVYYADFRSGGTLTAFVKHHAVDDVLAGPGSRDITAHVDFTALAKAGEKVGLATLGLIDQQRFFMGVAHDELSGTAGPRVGIKENVRGWNTLTRPEFLGANFQVLVQAKNAPDKVDGLRFARTGGLD